MPYFGLVWVSNTHKNGSTGSYVKYISDDTKDNYICRLWLLDILLTDGYRNKHIMLNIMYTTQ